MTDRRADEGEPQAISACPKCDYDVRFRESIDRCPECGLRYSLSDLVIEPYHLFLARRPQAGLRVFFILAVTAYAYYKTPNIGIFAVYVGTMACTGLVMWVYGRRLGGRRYWIHAGGLDVYSRGKLLFQVKAVDMASVELKPGRSGYQAVLIRRKNTRFPILIHLSKNPAAIEAVHRKLEALLVDIRDDRPVS
jgi:hypothetical protein